jgi:hypothetical protein
MPVANTPSASGHLSLTEFMPRGDPKELQVVSDLRTLYLAARDEKRNRYDNWMRNYRLVHNRVGGTVQNWMPAPRDSEIYPGLSSLVAWMTDQEIDIDLIPSADPNSQLFDYVSHIADDLNDVLYTTWMTESFDSQIKLALWDATMYGTGILKNVWDNALSGGYGNAVMKRTDPWAFYVDPAATCIADAEYMVEVRKVSLDELQRRFPDTWKKVAKSSQTAIEGFDEKPKIYGNADKRVMTNPGQIPSSGQWPGSASRVGTFAGRPQDRRLYLPDPGYILYEYWLKINDEYEEEWPDLRQDGDEDTPEYADNRVKPSWRFVALCNAVVLLDVPVDEMWSHGQPPYEDFRFDDIGEFYGIALVDHLAHPQIYVNRLLTALQHNAELTGNPIFIESANSGLNRVNIINRPGQRLTVSGPGAMQNRPDWLTPPAMPQQVMDLVQFWISRIENTMSLSALQKGITPTQRNAEGALNMVQEAAFVRVRSALTNLQDCLQRSAVKLADLVVDNYTQPRIMAIIGEEGGMAARALSGQHFHVPSRHGSTPLKYVIRVEAGSGGPTSRAARMGEADKLYGLGAVDDEYVLNKHRVRNAKAVLSRLYEKRQKGLMGMPGGKRSR